MCASTRTTGPEPLLGENGQVLVVLIHGTYTSPWHWHRVVPLLEAAGCEAHERPPPGAAHLVYTDQPTVCAAAIEATTRDVA
jgi:hypothetical protein